MRKFFTVLATFALSNVFVFAQDIIVTKDSKRIDAKVLEVNINDVKYKDWSNLEGPTYTILKSDIASIIYYGTGKVETFANAAQPQEPQYNGDVSMTLSRFNAMSDDEQDEYFERNVGGNIYDTFHSGVNLRRTGRGLLASGLALSGAGLLYISIGLINDFKESYFLTGGYVFLGIGETLVIVSIPLNAAGGGKKKAAQNEYINRYLKNTSSYKPELNFGFTASGIGFTVNF
ncbi:MAG: hypothetical protein LBB53_01050 [Prevotellaceae bacterium]|jgi:hypothetical protein|nr:hypothetical protein [Prevotellaceae bacterium]